MALSAVPLQHEGWARCPVAIPGKKKQPTLEGSRQTACRFLSTHAIETEEINYSPLCILEMQRLYMRNLIVKDTI